MKYSQAEIDTLFERQFRCEMCGDEIDSDYQWCPGCQDHAGSWIYVDKDGEKVDLGPTNTDAMPELIRATERLLERLEAICNEPSMQTKVDEFGNEACRTVRSGIRTAKSELLDVLRRAKQD